MWLMQTTLNIGILYTVGKNFSPLVWIRDHYLKIKLYLAQVSCQSFTVSHGKACWRSGHFSSQRRVASWIITCAEHDGMQDRHKKWPLTDVRAPCPPWFTTGSLHNKRWCFMAKWARPSFIGELWPQCPGACPLMKLRQPRSRLVHVDAEDRERWLREGEMAGKGEEEREKDRWPLIDGGFAGVLTAKIKVHGSGEDRANWRQREREKDSPSLLTRLGHAGPVSLFF